MYDPAEKLKQQGLKQSQAGKHKTVEG